MKQAPARRSRRAGVAFSIGDRPTIAQIISITRSATHIRRINMIVGTLEARFVLRGVRSLKEKRRIVKSLKGRLASRFNISIAEVAHQDDLRQAVLGVAAVAGDKPFLESVLDKVANFMERDPEALLAERFTEFH